jgi:hypothetical protein
MAGARDHVVGIAAVHHHPGDDRLAAQVFHALAAGLADAAGAVVPGHADAVAQREVRDVGAALHHAAHHLVAGNQVRLGRTLERGLVALGHVQVRVADAADLDLDQHVVRAGHRARHLFHAEGGAEFMKDGGLHGISSSGKRWVAARF